MSETPNPAPLRLYGPRFQQDPAALYETIRRDYGPVAPVLLDGDIPAWFVSGYREIHQVSDDSQLFARDTRRWNMWERIPDDWPLLPYVAHNPSVMFTEGPEHRRRAGAIGDALGAVDQFELRAQCERLADGLIDSFAGTGEADLVAQYAIRMPLLVIAYMYGLPPHEVPELVRDIAISLDVGPDAIPAHLRVQAAMQRLLAQKHEQPGPDIPSLLIQHPANLSDEEIVLDLLVVTAAAQQPTANWIGNTIRLMLTDARFAMTLSGGRGSVGQALNEVLWQDTPTQNFIGRFATRDTQLGGQRVRAGDLLVLGLAAANSDPLVRPDSDAGSAGNQAHMSFGHGEHGCPYPAPEVAEVIAKTTVEVLLDRLPDLELAVPVEELLWHPSVWMRGLERLPVRFTPTYVAAQAGMSAAARPW
ncbi:cytochrome P450 [Amycolatopsis acidiphila]|uniref:Cytochrome P450 n=1 Tax=Amycolatopsis acidiphila TaxID=715473 RepID=A0A558AH18_9PSEU|nr:cytochrome P450 [Amycolatopsis acidiphila]TVT23501.1 cytochrome P450 [Amycolatopsis acidiphila]UIJ59961.1 cytochrome P450 [Amycolatopsis acidiphila]GHG62191.1 cytochrome P450 [Amycolatopsis acidiphila]